MHESGLVEGVLAVVLEAAGDETVSRVRLRLGLQQHVGRDSFDLHWRILAAATPASEAALELNEAPGRDVVVEEIELEGGEVLRNPHLVEEDVH